MSRHNGVECNACKKVNFRGKRYKCLRCYDYDLCSTCYETKNIPTSLNHRHLVTHAMQCILSKHEFELYYGGENVSMKKLLSFTCPLCNKMGFTELTLQEHASLEHLEEQGVLQLAVCPICITIQGRENAMTEDFVAHITMEHATDAGLNNMFVYLEGLVESRTASPNSSSNVLINQRQPISPTQTLNPLNVRPRRLNLQNSTSGLEFSEMFEQLTEIRTRMAVNSNAHTHRRNFHVPIATYSHTPLNARSEINAVPHGRTLKVNTSKKKAVVKPAITAEEPIPQPITPQPPLILSKLFSLLDAQSNKNQDEKRGLFMQELLLSSLFERKISLTAIIKNLQISNSKANCVDSP